MKPSAITAVALQPLAIFALGIAMGYLLSGASQIPHWSKRVSKDKGVFFLGVTLKFKTVEGKEKVKELFKPVADYVATHEMSTVSYEMLESDKDDKLVYIAERYQTKDAYLNIHKKSPEFLKFRAKLTELSDTYEMEGNSYIESNIGFF
jgi:quinol monooxygenase YgiN